MSEWKNLCPEEQIEYLLNLAEKQQDELEEKERSVRALEESLNKTREKLNDRTRERNREKVLTEDLRCKLKCSEKIRKELERTVNAVFVYAVVVTILLIKLAL